MRHPTDSSDDSIRGGPWPSAADLSGLYDHGQAWCANAAGHPDVNDGYPDADRHLPWHECRTAETYVDDVVADLDGSEVGVAVYAAAPFRFGKPWIVGPGVGRIVIETWGADAEDRSTRISIARGEALRLARILTKIVDELTFVASPD